MLHIENRQVILAVSNYTTMGEGSGLCRPGIDMIKLLSWWCWWRGGGSGDSGGGHRFNRRYEILLPTELSLETNISFWLLDTQRWCFAFFCQQFEMRTRTHP